jgi:L-fuculose-phosphate aldolase
MTVPAEVLSTLAEVGADLYHLGLVTSHGGNLSIRTREGMWITGTGTMLGRLRERHISLVRPDGRHEGPPPSSDTMLHSTIYAVTGANAVVHAHPRHATVLSFDLDVFTPPDFEGRLHLGDVPVIDTGPMQIERLAGAMQARVAVILRGHGAYARGGTPWEALHWMTALEESAHIETIRRSITPASSPPPES